MMQIGSSLVLDKRSLIFFVLEKISTCTLYSIIFIPLKSDFVQVPTLKSKNESLF